MFHPTDRLAIFIDGSNLYSAARALQHDMDFRRMLDWFNARSRLVRASYYTAVVEGEEFSPIRPLVDWLDYNGFSVVTKPVRRFTDAQGHKPTPEWDSWDDNGNPKTYTGADALKQVASDVGEPSVISRTGGAPTLSVGMAHILHQIGGGRTMMGFWYHFAIMFEALFILTAVDAVTRVARFQLGDALGNVWPKFKDPSWHVGAWGTTAVVVASWGALLLMGVTDPRGGIQTLYPLFGIANQLIAAVALLVVTVMVVRKGYTKWVWIPAIPLVFDTAVTFTASWQKIFSSDPLVGYFQQHREAVAKLGTLTDPAKIEETRAIVRNTMIQGTLSIIFAALVIVVFVAGAIVALRAIRDAGGQPRLLMPLSVAREGCVTVARGFGGGHANFHMPLFASREAAAVSADDLAAAMIRACSAPSRR